MYYDILAATLPPVIPHPAASSVWVRESSSVPGVEILESPVYPALRDSSKRAGGILYCW